MRAQNQSRINPFTVFNATGKKVPVVVKVFSLAVHRYLVHPEKSFFALHKINCGHQLSPETRKVRSHVLYTVMADLTKEDYAVYEPPIGMITIMGRLDQRRLRGLDTGELCRRLSL
jgi:hypothetical protein